MNRQILIHKKLNEIITLINDNGKKLFPVKNFPNTCGILNYTLI